MIDMLRRFRGLAIALVVLAVSAGAVFAAAPGLAPTAAPQAQTEEPTGEPTASPDEDGDENGDQDGDEDATPEAPEAPEAPDADEDGTAVEAPADNHGAIVSTAAKTETPAGFANHGQFVSCVAHMAKEDPALVLTTVTPEACGITPDEAKATGKEKAAEKKAAGKAKGEAAKARAAERKAAKASSRP